MGAYETDGMYGMPVINVNCLESVENAIAFDVSDWAKDRRCAWIYGIVFGWGECIDDIQKKFHWTDSDIERLNELHKQWIEIKKQTERIFNGRITESK